VIVQLWVDLAVQPLHFPNCDARSRWCFIDAHYWDIVAMLSQLSLPRKVADSSIMSCCRHAASRFFMRQCQKMLTKCWRSFWGCGNERVIYIVRYNADQYIHFGRMRQFSQLIGDCVTVKIVDTKLMLTLITSKQPLYTQWLCVTNLILIIDNQYCIWMCYRLHPGVLLPFNL
jgi:hypothetical protein